VEAGVAVCFLKKISGVRCLVGATHTLLFIEKLHEVLAQDVVVFNNANAYHGGFALESLKKRKHAHQRWRLLGVVADGEATAPG
jgi:hypothetical protein